jgi:hypothetical protein
MSTIPATQEMKIRILDPGLPRPKKKKKKKKKKTLVRPHLNKQAGCGGAIPAKGEM